MAKISNGQTRIESITDLRLRFDIKELFGITLDKAPELRKVLGQAIIDKIEKRTQKRSKDIFENDFKDYSESYINSQEFKDSGKTPKVNMTLTGDMLSDVDILRDNPKEIVIGFTDSVESAKAHGHVTGGVGVTRDFFGLSDRDIRELKRDFMPEIKQALKIREDKGRSEFQKAVLDILDQERFGNGEG